MYLCCVTFHILSFALLIKLKRLTAYQRVGNCNEGVDVQGLVVMYEGGLNSS